MLKLNIASVETGPHTNTVISIHCTGKKMTAGHFTTKPCEINTVNSHVFGEIHPCNNNIVYARFEVL